MYAMEDQKVRPWVPRSGSTFFLSLNASLQELHRPRGFSEVALAKQASILADTLLVETGLVFIETDGWMSNSADMPYHMLDQPASSLAAIRNFTPGLNRGLIGAPGGKLRYAPVPSERPDERMHGPIIARWAAEFHTAVLSELARLDADWYVPIRFGSADEKLLIFEQPMNTIFSEARGAPDSWRRHRSKENYTEFLAAVRSVAPNVGLPSNVTDHSRTTLEEFGAATLTNAFQRAAIQALALGAQFAPSNAVAASQGDLRRLQGAAVLDLLVPNVTELPWEAICEFREHRGATEARHLIGEFERRAARAGPEDGVEYLRSISRDVNHALFDAVAQLRPRLPRTMAEQIASTAVGFVPLIGPVASLFPGWTRAAADAQAYSRSWVAALLTLQRP
jgi:hypothetical protein